VRSHGAVIASTFRAGTSAAPPEASRREASLRVPIGYGKVRVSISALGASTLTVVRRTARARVRTWRQERRIGPDLRNACAAAIALPSADDADDAVGLVRARLERECAGLLGDAPRPPPVEAEADAADDDDPPPALAAATAAWRQAPADLTRRTALRAAWRGSTWRPQSPDRPEARAATSSWLVLRPEGAAATVATTDDTHGLWQLPAGATTSVLVLAGPDPAAPALVTLRLVAERIGELATLTIDGRDYPAAALAGVTPLTFAIAPGTHTMAVRAGPDVRVLVDGARVQSPGLMGPAAWRQRYAPVPASGDVLGFEVPADAPAIRLALRRVATAAAGHARVTVHGASGWQTTIDLTTEAATAAADALAVPLDDAPPVGARAEVTLWPPPGVGRVWLTTDDPAIVAAVAIRTNAPAPPTAALVSPPVVPGAQALPRLVELTAQIAATPRAVAPRLERATLLLDLGEAGLARTELGAVLSLDRDLDDDGVRDQLAPLIARTAPRASSDYLPPQPPGQPAVLPLAPALLAMPAASVAGIAPALATLAGGGRPAPLATDDDDLARRWLAAYAQRGDADPTPMLHTVLPLLDRGCWQAGLDALGWTPREALTPTVAEATYAVARAVDEQITHPLARARLALAGRHSAWVALRGTDRSAGFVRVPVAASAAADDGDAVRRALVPGASADAAALGAPEVLGPTELASLRTDGPRAGEVTLSGACAEPFATQPPACGLRWRLDGGAWTDVAPGVVTRVAVPAGKHLLEAGPRDLGPDGFATLHLHAPDALVATMTTRLDWATASTPVELVVAGPAMVRLDLRDDLQDAAGRAVVTLDGATAGAAAIVLDATADPDVATFRLAARTSTVVRVSAPGPHVVKVSVPRGRVAVRALRRTGVERADVPRPDLTLPPATVAPAPAAERADVTILLPPASGAGRLAPLTAAFELTLGTRDTSARAGEAIAMAQHAEAAAAVMTSRGTGRAALELRGRAWDARPTAFGIRSRARWQARPSLALAVDLRGDASASDDGLAWSVRGNLATDYYRPVATALKLQLGGDLAARAFDGVHADDLDARVASSYGYDHPVSLQPRVGLRYAPLQDLEVRSLAEAHTNADLVSLDRVTIGASVRSQVELGHLHGPVAQLGYAPSLLLADEHRSSSAWRHTVRAGLEHLLWRPRVGYLQLALDAAVTLQAEHDVGSTITLSLRWLQPGGRGLRDLWPGDIFPLEYAEPRWWQDAR
jgi:hypothetical protein